MSDDFRPGQPPGDLEVVVLPAEIDLSNAQLVLDALAAVIRRGVRLVVADMSGTVFCDCSGVAAFAAAWRQAAAAGTDLRIVITHRQVRRLFQLTYAKFHIYKVRTTGRSGEIAARDQAPVVQRHK